MDGVRGRGRKRGGNQRIYGIYRDGRIIVLCLKAEINKEG
jgi:hypothetical protein